MSYGADMMAGYELGTKVRDRIKTGKSEFQHRLDAQREEERLRREELAERMRARGSEEKYRGERAATDDKFRERELTARERDMIERGLLARQMQALREDEATAGRWDKLTDQANRQRAEMDQFVQRRDERLLKEKEIAARIAQANKATRVVRRTDGDATIEDRFPLDSNAPMPSEEPKELSVQDGVIKTKMDELDRSIAAHRAAMIEDDNRTGLFNWKSRQGEIDQAEKKRELLRALMSKPTGQSSPGQKPATGSPTPDDEMVRVIGKDGRPYQMPKKNLPTALQRGYRLVN